MEVLFKINDLIHIDVATLPNNVVCGIGSFGNTDKWVIRFIATKIDNIIYFNYKFGTSYRFILERYELSVTNLQNNVLSVTSLPNTVTIRFLEQLEPIVLHNNKENAPLPMQIQSYLENIFDEPYVLK